MRDRLGLRIGLCVVALCLMVGASAATAEDANPWQGPIPEPVVAMESKTFAGNSDHPSFTIEVPAGWRLTESNSFSWNFFEVKEGGQTIDMQVSTLLVDGMKTPISGDDWFNVASCQMFEYESSPALVGVRVHKNNPADKKYVYRVQKDKWVLSLTAQGNPGANPLAEKLPALLERMSRTFKIDAATAK